MPGVPCDYVTRYLEKFLDEGTRCGVDLEQVGMHVQQCSACYSRLSKFFRTIELPESSYLRETIDELALALYNLGKSIIRDRPQTTPEDVTENLRITVPGGGTEDENLRAGEEMIDDAEDYVGSSRVGDVDLEALRADLQGATTSKRMRLDLALEVFTRLTQLQSRYLAPAWNWIGVLHLQKSDWSSAEASFLNALSVPDGKGQARAFAHCNLGYVFKQKGDLDRAIRSAERSVIFAEEDGEDAYFGLFAQVYFLLLRGRPGDLQKARSALNRLLTSPERRRGFVSDLQLASNSPVLETFLKSPLAEGFPELVRNP